MICKSEDYRVKDKQLEKLEETLEKVEEFNDFITSGTGFLHKAILAEVIEDNDNRELGNAHEQFSRALRELKYLVEDIEEQELDVVGK